LHTKYNERLENISEIKTKIYGNEDMGDAMNKTREKVRNRISNK